MKITEYMFMAGLMLLLTLLISTVSFKIGEWHGKEMTRIEMRGE